MILGEKYKKKCCVYVHNDKHLVIPIILQTRCWVDVPMDVWIMCHTYIVPFVHSGMLYRMMGYLDGMNK